jgi:hypothetical protein
VDVKSKRLNRAVGLYRAGLRDSAILVVTLSAMTVIGGLLTLWAPVGNSGYWSNVAAAPPFALLVIIAGEIPLSMRASLARCRNYRESIRRSASSIFQLLWLLEQDWNRENAPKGDKRREPAHDLILPISTDQPGGALGDYLELLNISTERTQSAAHQSQQDGSQMGSVRAFLVFNRLREDLSDLAFSVRQLEQEPAALLSGSVNEVLRSTADISTKFISGLAGDLDRRSMRERSKALTEGILEILEVADAMLPQWASPKPAGQTS